MALNVRWTSESEDTFSDIINYLEQEWTEKEIRKFAQKTQKIILQIAKNPKMYKATGKEEIRRAVITKQTSLFYHINEVSNLITLLAFWDNRKNPNDLIY
ncbi:MAG TPA: type II toxin-antitoxin system RelE/ParE family toxin [Draconibacterium sp.]|jgi:plasmid stabilization system protein ParE|nr:type II toxin-antitoxin system RelE/ParE family toxin [Draconibacterium sp.]